MKKCFSLLVFIIPALLSAQEWKPLNSGEKFNYRIDTAVIISNVIAVDSVKIENGDSVFYLNRVVKPCSGCVYPQSYLANQPQFLKCRMVRHAGGLYVFSNPGKFQLRTLAGVSQSWIFDSVAGITAQVASKTYELVLNQWDSVKTIQLSNGQMIRLSKNHGLMQFPETGTSHTFSLTGIAGRNLGELLPGFKEMYNYNVGDVFQYRYESMSYAIGDGSGGLIKHRIISKDSSATGYTYGMQVYTISWYESMIGFHSDSTHHYEVGTSVLVDSATDICNHYPGQLVLDPEGLGGLPYTASLMVVANDTGQSIARIMGPPDAALFYTNGSDTLNSVGGVLGFIKKYTTGLGLVIDNLSIFESASSFMMIGYVKNGCTVGTVYSDDFLLEKLPENAAPGDVKMFPNPARDKVFITLSPNFWNMATIELQAPDGRILQNIPGIAAKHTYSFDVSALPKGLYFVSISDQGGTIRRKLVVD
jgi:hypothetical protein